MSLEVFKLNPLKMIYSKCVTQAQCSTWSWFLLNYISDFSANLSLM